MAGDADDSQKTEDPSARRLSKAFEEGNVPKSQEATAWFMLLAIFVLLLVVATPYSFRLGGFLEVYLAKAHTFRLDAESSLSLFVSLSIVVMVAFAVPGVLMAASAIIGNLAQHPPTFSARTIEPKLDKLDPIKGLQRVFGMQSWINVLKAIGKLVIVSAVVYFVIWPDQGLFLDLLKFEPAAILPISLKLTVKILGAIVAVMAVIALADLAYQRFQHTKQLRMTKQEVRDEHKDMEGDPKIKAKIRQVRAERARRRMMAAVPSATVVVTNPTHFSVALKYEDGVTAAPVVVAKGVDEVALRIRLIAKEHKVPIIENPPLARMLHATVEVDEAVPPEHYKAVAEVIGYVLRLKRPARRRPPQR